MLIQLYGGRYVDPRALTASDIDIQDISASLANVCRFGGHVDTFYSVAQHSVLVCRYVMKRDPSMGLAALLHDAAEAYIGDIMAPLKRELPAVADIETDILRVVFDRYGVDAERAIDAMGPGGLIHEADMVALVTERRDLKDMSRPDLWPQATPLAERIDPLPPVHARRIFLQWFDSLR